MKKKNAPPSRPTKVIVWLMAIPLVAITTVCIALWYPTILGYIEAYGMRFWQLPSDTQALHVTADHICDDTQCLVWGHLTVTTPMSCASLWDYLDVQNPDETLFVRTENEYCVITLEIEIDS